MALTLGPVIGTVGGDTWEETPVSVPGVGRFEYRTVTTPPDDGGGWSSLRTSPSPSTRAQQQPLCGSGMPIRRSQSGRPRPPGYSSPERLSRFEAGTLSVPGPSPARSTRCLCPTDLVGGL